MSRLPEPSAPKNSQTIDLLAGNLNINPRSYGGPLLAIVDDSALDAEISSGEDIFLDLGKSGTGQISVYTVRSGDTLSEIAEMFGVSTNTILWANNLTRTSKIKVGQELVILPISGVRHTVKSGDTLQSIAKKYKADLDEILVYNGLSEDSKIAVKDVILVPNGEITVAQTKTVSSGKTTSYSTSVPSGYFIRPIQGGRKSQHIHGHNAVDLAPDCRCSGDPIYASASGTVIVARKSGYNGGYGLYVVITHPNGIQTVYGHMSRVDVSVGQSVSQGQVIGALGNTGRSTGPHVHFEIRGAKNPF